MTSEKYDDLEDDLQDDGLTSSGENTTPSHEPALPSGIPSTKDWNNAYIMGAHSNGESEGTSVQMTVAPSTEPST